MEARILYICITESVVWEFRFILDGLCSGIVLCLNHNP